LNNDQGRNSAAALTGKNRICRCLGTKKPANSLRKTSASQPGGESPLSDRLDPVSQIKSLKPNRSRRWAFVNVFEAHSS
jgi:hypothetical protein